MFASKFGLLGGTDRPLCGAPGSVRRAVRVVTITRGNVFRMDGGGCSGYCHFRSVGCAATARSRRVNVFRECYGFLGSLSYGCGVAVGGGGGGVSSLHSGILVTRGGSNFGGCEDVCGSVVRRGVVRNERKVRRRECLAVAVREGGFRRTGTRFTALRTAVRGTFVRLNTRVMPLGNGRELGILCSCCRLKSRNDFSFSVGGTGGIKTSFGGSLYGKVIGCFPSRFRSRDGFYGTLFVGGCPDDLSSEFVGRVASLPIRSVADVSMIPIPGSLAAGILRGGCLNVRSSVVGRREVHGGGGSFSARVSCTGEARGGRVRRVVSSIHRGSRYLFFIKIAVVLVTRDGGRLSDIYRAIRAVKGHGDYAVSARCLGRERTLGATLPVNMERIRAVHALLARSLTMLVPFGIRRLGSDANGCCNVGRVDGGIGVNGEGGLVGKGNFMFNIPNSNGSFFYGVRVNDMFLSKSSRVVIVSPVGRCFSVTRACNKAIMGVSACASGCIGPLRVSM